MTWGKSKQTTECRNYTNWHITQKNIFQNLFNKIMKFLCLSLAQQLSRYQKYTFDKMRPLGHHLEIISVGNL